MQSTINHSEHSEASLEILTSTFLSSFACSQIQSATVTANSSIGSIPKMDRSNGGCGQAIFQIFGPDQRR
jgi:hypothetical protein